MRQYDLIVIGGGAAGLTVAAGAVQFGLRVALIEKEAQPGGDCLHFGCVPSKSLIDAAKSIHEGRKRATSYGLKVEGEVDLVRVMDKIRAAIATIQPHDSSERFRQLGVDVIHGKASFDDAHHLRIDDGERIFAHRFVITTGSTPYIPQIAGIAEVGYLTNETIFQLEKLPERLVVIGAGAIGLELAQAFSRLGSDVTVLEQAPIFLPNEDQQIADVLLNGLQQEMTIHLNTSIVKLASTENEQQIFATIDGEQRMFTSDAILLASGRRPNTAQLALERAGVVVSNRGHIVVNERLQTSQSHIYAAGDVLDRFAFTHAAGMEGKLIVANAVFGLRKRVGYNFVPWVIYTDPELFHLGLTESQARAKHGDTIKVYVVDLKDVDRFVTEKRTAGCVKMVTDRKGRILGAHAVGYGAGDWMQQVVMAMQHGIRIGSISQIIHPYPSRAAAVQRVADQYWRKRMFGGSTLRWMRRFVKWYWRFVR
jgi:pyruvate/2-oxoglutarate dehydrogenase complex dihydrolipoamide dehydrogenase (E3) component